MDISILKIAVGVAGIGGLVIGSFTILFRQFLRKKFFSQLTKKQTFRILVIFLFLVWSVAIAGIYFYFLLEKIDRTRSLSAKIEDLIDTGPRILKEKKKMDREFFEDFVKPFYENFEDVHKTYLASFKKYQGMIDDKNRELDSAHPVFAEIKKDMLFTADQRRNLGNMAEAIYPNEADATAARQSLNYNLEWVVILVYRYIRCIHPLGENLTDRYFVHSHPIPSELFSAEPNVIRLRIENSLTKIFSSNASREEKYKEASKAINEAVSILQEIYINTAKHYHRLKVDLLRADSPKN